MNLGGPLERARPAESPRSGEMQASAFLLFALLTCLNTRSSGCNLPKDVRLGPGKAQSPERETQCNDRSSNSLCMQTAAGKHAGFGPTQL